MVAQTASLQHVQHPPERTERQEDHERLRPVEVRELDVDDRERQQAGRECPHRPAEQPLAQEVQQQHRAGVHERRYRPPGRCQVLEAHLVHHRFEPEADAHQQVDDDGAEREPVRVERARVLIEEGGDRREARLVEREVAVGASLPARSVGERAVHAVHAHVDRALVGVVEVPAVPVDPLEPEPERPRRDDERQQQEQPRPIASKPGIPRWRWGALRGHGLLHG